MQRLTRRGYKIEIKNWVGNFGNHLLQLSGALKVAIETESILTYPKNDLIPKHIFDFRDLKNKNCDLQVSSCFFYHDECFQYPLRYDQERRNISVKYILPLLQKKYEKIKDDEWKYSIEDSLVINIRSGDIFRDDYDSEDAVKSGIKNYVQPPLSFYKKIIDQFHYEKIIVVTQPDHRNPVINELLKLYNRITLKQHFHPLDDFMTLLKAKYLVTCHSSFSWFAGLMSDNLSVLHQPKSFSIKGIKDFDVYTYEVKNYIPHGSWKPTASNLKKMITLPERNIKMIYENRAGGLIRNEIPMSTFGVTRGWVPEKKSEPKVFVQSRMEFLWNKVKMIIRPRTRIKSILDKISNCSK